VRLMTPPQASMPLLLLEWGSVLVEAPQKAGGLDASAISDCCRRVLSATRL
jgi:hypothetical protein